MGGMWHILDASLIFIDGVQKVYIGLQWVLTLSFQQLVSYKVPTSC